MLLLNELDVMAQGSGVVFSRVVRVGVAIGMTAEELQSFVLVFGTKAVAEGAHYNCPQTFGRVGGSDVP
jgi:hypothetical protein